MRPHDIDCRLHGMHSLLLTGASSQLFKSRQCGGSTHHLAELLEVDLAVAVDVGLLDHVGDFGVGDLPLPRRYHDGFQLGGGDGAVAVPVKGAESLCAMHPQDRLVSESVKRKLPALPHGQTRHAGAPTKSERQTSFR